MYYHENLVNYLYFNRKKWVNFDFNLVIKDETYANES